MATLEKGPGPYANDGRRDAGQQSPRIIIASDVRLYREGLATTLAGLGRLSIIGTVAGSDLTLDCLLHFGPDVVLLDMALSGCLCLPGVLNTEPPVKFVAFAVAEGDDGALACAEAGFSGYVGKDGSPEELALTIEGNDNSHRRYPRDSARPARRSQLLDAVVSFESG